MDFDSRRGVMGFSFRGTILLFGENGTLNVHFRPVLPII